jgi:hydroxyacylglutathione hydrolase
MILYTFPSGPFATNVYVVGCPSTKKAAIIDAAPDCQDEVLSCLKYENLTPDKILLTHTHWDHIGDALKLKLSLNIPIYVHPLDQDNLIHPGADGLPLLFPISGLKPDAYLHEGAQVPIGMLNFLVIHTPGHTPGGICLYNNENNVLFTGDTLFHGSIGNLSFPTADKEKMWTSLRKLEALPKETKFYPGHGEPSILKHETWLKDAKTIFDRD